jgi:hypothetical protein
LGTRRLEGRHVLDVVAFSLLLPRQADHQHIF